MRNVSSREQRVAGNAAPLQMRRDLGAKRPRREETGREEVHLAGAVGGAPDLFHCRPVRISGAAPYTVRPSGK